MKIPFLNLSLQYQSIKNEIDTAIENVIQDNAFIKGKYVSKFEEEFSTLHSVKHCIGVGNGTDALYITLKTLNISIGDEVLVPANTWISCSEAVTLTGATPIFVDVDEFYTIDPDKLIINSNTKAIICVHLYGQMADVQKLNKICEKHNLLLIEDCAQSHLSQWDGNYAGTFGVASIFSFFPSKNLGAYGDAGCILTNNDELAEKIRRYANHGSIVKHDHKFEGINSRLDGLQASILSAKLIHLKRWTTSRINNATNYTSLLNGINEVEIPQVRENTKHSFHVYCIKATSRYELREYLSSKGIETKVHYPSILPLLEAYNDHNFISINFEQCLSNQDKILSLPLFPEITQLEQEYVVDHIAKFYT